MTEQEKKLLQAKHRMEEAGARKRKKEQSIRTHKTTTIHRQIRFPYELLSFFTAIPILSEHYFPTVCSHLSKFINR